MLIPVLADLKEKRLPMVIYHSKNDFNFMYRNVYTLQLMLKSDSEISVHGEEIVHFLTEIWTGKSSL